LHLHGFADFANYQLPEIGLSVRFGIDDQHADGVARS
jgi:hypothetical protein